LAILSLISLNLVVGFFKFWLGRTKPKVGIDLLHFGGMSYPSGHASNALLTWGVLAYLIYRYAHVDRYRGRLASAGVATISLTVCIVSLVRDTHWFSDLLGGLFIGGALLVLVIAIDRYWPSNSQLS
jgi:membrane-associated phospholipid phosphatase